MSHLIVIPTFNERDNIQALVERLLAHPSLPDVCVVDDDSPDGTHKIVADIARHNTRLRLMHRVGKKGRGSAVLDGLTEGLKGNYQFIFEMDADFSHEPNELSRFLEVPEDMDLVIGSRYLSGSTIVNWPLRRRLFSFLANRYARAILGVPLSDYTNGYRRYRADALRCIDLTSITATGYIVLSYLSYRLYRQGARIAEVPIRFVNRKRGASNLSRHEIWHALTAVLSIPGEMKKRQAFMRKIH